MAEQNNQTLPNTPRDEPNPSMSGIDGKSAQGSQLRSVSNIGSQTGSAAATARTLIDHAKETAGQAYDAVTDTAASKLDEKKTTVAEGLSSVADSIRQAGDNVGQNPADNPLTEYAANYSRTAAEKIESVANYFERTDVRGMTRDVENFARRNPAIFIGAAFGLGLLAARFLKSSKPDRSVRAGATFASNDAEFDEAPRQSTGLPSSSQF